MQRPFADLQASIAALATRVEAVDIRRFESYPPEILVSELAPLVRTLLAEAHVVVADVVETCEREAGAPAADEGNAPGPYAPFEAALDTAVERRKEWSVAAVGDIGFLAGLELRQRLERLERLSGLVPRGSHHVLVGECDSALRRIRKALMTIDRALSQAGVTEARLDFASELEVSLDVRRTYAKLRRRVQAIGPPEGDTFYVQLRAIGTALATVVGWKGYSNLRVRDRMQMRELQRRLLDWFRTERDPTEGRRLWQDLDYFVQMLADVNRRQELEEHDARVVEQAWPVVATTDGALPSSTMTALASLEGLDEEIDRLLASESRDRALAWRAPLGRLRSGPSGPKSLP